MKNNKKSIASEAVLIQTKQIATNLLKQNARLLGQNQAQVLNNFLNTGMANNKKFKTQQYCEKILNISFDVNNRVAKKHLLKEQKAKKTISS